MAHYEQTAEEIIDALDGKIDYVFIGAGTGGTVSGIGKKIEEKVPKCQVFCVLFNNIDFRLLVLIQQVLYLRKRAKSMLRNMEKASTRLKVLDTTLFLVFWSAKL